MRAMWAARSVVLAWGACFCAGAGQGQNPVKVQVQIIKAGKTSASGKATARDSSDVAIWLTPAVPQAQPVGSSALSGPTATIVQEGKMFVPHVTVVRVGTAINFPNEDPFFHNVFSLYDGKRFDLGLYESGTSRAIRFTRPGVSYLFCNIHENMSALVIAVDTPYFGVSDRSGLVSIADVPDGRYTMHAFYERGSVDALKSAERVVTISSSSRSIDMVAIAESTEMTLAHKNKYGQDYVPPSSGYAP